MACNDYKCGKSRNCEKSVCCGVCVERSNCPYGDPCPTCTGNPTNDKKSDDERSDSK